METIIIEEFRKGITDIKSGIHETQEDVTNLQSTIKSVQDENQKLHCELDKVRKQLLLRATSPSAPRRPGLVSEQCARHLAASFILGAARFSLILFPLFILFALLSMRKVWYATITVWSLLFLALFTGLYVESHFVY